MPLPLDITQLGQALDKGEFEPFFQPVVELNTGRLAGFEVLARWRHPQNGTILPSSFIPLAEERGLVGTLMQEILRKALLPASDLPDPLALAVNVSPSQLHDISLVSQIRKAADDACFPLNRLIVEITVGALAHDMDQAVRFARELKATGCRLALDDFGTGYSSLRHLQSLPFDELKIDGSFVSEMTKKRDSRKIVAAIIGLG